MATPPATKSRFPLWLLPALLVAIFLGAAAAHYFKKNATDPDDLLTGPAPRSAPPGMVWIPGGTFLMGSDDADVDWKGRPLFADSRPIHKVSITGFFMEIHEVTNDEFAKFVAATGYVTLAEKPVNKDELMKTLPPGVEPTPEMLVAGSLVFVQPAGPVDLSNTNNWWAIVAGANWRHPQGPNSNIDNKGNHPVVQIAWADAIEYCKWSKKRLPTEAEWEYAARGGLEQKHFTWGDESPEANGKARCNFWQGEFPWKNTAVDGYAGTAPAGSYAPNAYGLHDMAGNVWEWCHDWYMADAYRNHEAKNPQGPKSSFDPADNNAKRIQRGGSFLCNPGFCSRYKPYGRGKGTPFEATSHVGFRCVQDAKQVSN
ncbi:formylglycine-generating enzyme family protein [soil metagenome]